MGAVQQKSGRFVTLVCDSEVYHSAADRWPEAVDVGLLARYARAFRERSAPTGTLGDMMQTGPLED